MLPGQVLMPADFHWVHSNNGYIPHGAVESGRTSNGEILYTGRVYHNGILTAGKVSCLPFNSYFFLSTKIKFLCYFSTYRYIQVTRSFIFPTMEKKFLSENMKFLYKAKFLSFNKNFRIFIRKVNR